MSPLRPLPVAIAALVLAGAAPVLAQQPPRRVPAPVIVHYRIVQAFEKAGSIDPGCKDLPPKLGPMNFRSMRLLEERRVRLGIGQQYSVRLPTGKTMRMRPLSIVEHRLHMHLNMPGLDTSFRMKPLRAVAVGGERHGDGHLLVYIESDF